MIRHPPTQSELSLDSMTDTVTNTMGLILLMVAISTVMSGGMKITLLHELTDPKDKTPIYLACKDGEVLFVHLGDRWLRDLEGICADLEQELGRKPTTTEALLEANKLDLELSRDFESTFIREISRGGVKSYIIGVSFLPRDEQDDELGMEEGPSGQQDVRFSETALAALEEADPAKYFIDAFVYETDFKALNELQAKAAERGFAFGWSVLLEHENPVLSETGVPSRISGGGS